MPIFFFESAKFILDEIVQAAQQLSEKNRQRIQMAPYIGGIPQTTTNFTTLEHPKPSKAKPS